MKKVFSAAALAVLMWVALAADAPRPNAKRVREIAGYLADEPGFPDTRITNRAVWDRLAGGPGAYYVEKAAGIAKEPVPFLDDATYTNIVWGGVSAKRTRNLNALVYGECLENKGRFLGRIIEYLDAMCAQTTWMNPYHDRPNFGNFHGKYRSVDLNTGESAIDIAMALDCLKGKLPEKTVKRALDALAEFVFTPYLIAAADPNAIHNCCSWFFCDSNWNCACHNQVVSAALRTVADKWKRAKFVEGAERGYPFFLAGFSKEGYCQEGIDYWNYGYGEFLRLGLTVRKATADKVDFFAHPKARKCFDYAHDFQLVKWCSPQFGDGNAAPSDNNFAMGEIVWPETRSDFTRSCMPVSYGLEDCILKIFRPGALDPKPPAPTFRLPIRTFFADAQVFLCRPFDSGLYTLSACIKGGHNGVPHNHNDAGAYVIALGGTQMVEDPANQKYDLDTFGPKRYESKMRNSYGHDVPFPGGALQKAGKQYSAKIIATSFTEARDLIEYDLAGAYDAPNVKELRRELVYDRANAAVGIRDRAVFSKPAEFESPISTYGRVEKGAAPNAFTIVRETKHGMKRLDFTVDTRGAKWHVKEENIPNPGRIGPTRFAIVLDEPATECEVRFAFTPGEMPPDFSWAVEVERGDEKGPCVTNCFTVADQTPEIEKLGDGKWRFTCDGLSTWNAKADVRVVLEAEMKGGTLAVSGELKNRGDATRVLSFDGPHVPAGEVVRGKTRFYYPYADGIRIRRFPTPEEVATSEKGRFGFFWWDRGDGILTYHPSLVCEYPSRRATMQWMTATDGERGWAYMVKDPKFGAKQSKVEYDPGKSALKFGFSHRLFMRSGESFEIPRTEISRYRGDWHVPASEYGTWFAKALPYAYVPDAEKDCTTLMLLICKQQNGEMVWPYGDFDKLADALEAHGITNLKILGRGPGGHDNLYPDYSPDPAQGGAEAFKRGLKILADRGIRTYAYVNGQLIERGTTDYWKNGGGSTAGVLCRDGTRACEGWLKYVGKPPHVFDVACPWAPAWLKRMHEVAREAQSLGFNGLYMDQTGKQWPWLCFATNHGHAPGTWVWTEDRVKYLKGIHDEMTKLDPDFILTSEGYCEPISGSCAIHLGLRDPGRITSRFDKDAWLDKYPEMTFYAIPQYITSDRWPSPTRTREDVNGTAVVNYRVDLEVRYPTDRKVFEKGDQVDVNEYVPLVGPPCDFRDFQKMDFKANRDYLKAVNGFRRMHRDVLLRGRFTDTEGFSVSAQTDKYIAKRWVSSDGAKSGVLVWNASAKPARFEVKTSGKFVGAFEPESGSVDPTTPISADSLRLYRYER